MFFFLLFVVSVFITKNDVMIYGNDGRRFVL